MAMGCIIVSVFHRFFVPLEDTPCNPLEIDAHLCHELGVLVRPISRNKGTEESRRHVEGVDVFFGFGVGAVLHEVCEYRYHGEKDVV